MPSFQRTQIIGHVGKQPELREFGGTQVANFSVAVTEKWTDSKTGEKREETNWYTCSVWGKRAAVIMQYVNKGDAIMLEGTTTARAYTRSNGELGASLELKVRDFTFLGGRDSHSDNGGQEYDEASGQELDDIPFSHGWDGVL